MGNTERGRITKMICWSGKQYVEAVLTNERRSENERLVLRKRIHF